jgi:hypothetical protein
LKFTTTRKENRVLDEFVCRCSVVTDQQL